MPVVHVGPPATGESAGQEEVLVVHRHEAAGVGGGHLGVGIRGQFLEASPVLCNLQIRLTFYSIRLRFLTSFKVRFEINLSFLMSRENMSRFDHSELTRKVNLTSRGSPW